MQIHNIKRPKSKIAPKQRVGRGGKRGTYSGKGGKGQTARAGRKIQSQLKEQLLRTPKMRGAGNVIIKKDIYEIQLRHIAEQCPNNFEVTEQSLRKQGLIPKRAKKFKIIGSIKKLDKKFSIKGIDITKSGKEIIGKAGGTIVKIEPAPKPAKFPKREKPVKPAKPAKK